MGKIKIFETTPILPGYNGFSLGYWEINQHIDSYTEDWRRIKHAITFWYIRKMELYHAQN
jgi:hypothetical protein